MSLRSRSPPCARGFFFFSSFVCVFVSGCVIFTVHLLLFEQGTREQEEEKAKENKKNIEFFRFYTQKKC